MALAVIAPVAAPISARHRHQAVTVGFDTTDTVCVWRTRTIGLSWTETPFSRNVVVGADGRCQTRPRYVVKVAAAVSAARGQARRLGLALVPGTLDVRVLDVRGPTGSYGVTATAANGTSRVAIDTYLTITGLRSVALHEYVLASENTIVHGALRRLPSWLTLGVATWAQAVAAPADNGQLASTLAALAGPPRPVASLAGAAVGFWMVTLGRQARTLRAALVRLAHTRTITTPTVVSALTRTLGPRLAAGLVGYADALARGGPFAGLPLPPGVKPRPDPPSRTAARLVRIPPLGVRLLTVTVATTGPLRITIRSQQPRPAPLLTTTSLVDASGGLVSPVLDVAGAALTVRHPGAATLVLTNPTSAPITLSVRFG